MSNLRINGEAPVFILQLTSKLIFIPAIVALFLKRWGDLIIISFLAISALWYHSSHSKISYYVDQIGIWLLVFHTFLLAITNLITPFLFILGFGYMLIVYSYGKNYNCFCFDPDINIADKYHASIHVLGIAIYCISMIFFLPTESNGIFFNIFNY